MKQCCGTSVGVLIQDAQGRYLMITRGTLPPGVACVAGHALDEHPDWEAAAHAEVSEEVGLTVTSLKELTQFRSARHPGRCRRTPASPPGHTWRLYGAQVTGDLAPSARETRGAAWYSARELQRLAERTANHAAGRISASDFAHTPGLEPVWCHWFQELGITRLPSSDLIQITELAATPPQ